MHKKTLFLSTLSLTTFLFADDEVRMRNIENRLTCLECGQAPCCAVNPPARPYDPDCWGFYIQAAPLIWQAHVNGTNVAIATSDSPNFFNTGKSRVKNINFNWDWGFRIGLGFNSCHDAWDTLLQWTRWRTDGTRKLSAPSDGALYPTRGVPSFIQDEIAQQVTSNWKMSYDILDLENGKGFYVSNCLILRPFAGLRTAWITQTFDTVYKDLAPAGTSPIPNNSHSVDQSDKFWGIGIRGGVETRWTILYDLSFFANTAANLLYAYHNVKQKEVTGPVGQEATILDVQNFFHVGTAIFDMQIGIGWGQCLCCDQYYLGIDLGWENHWHPGQNQFFTFVDDVMPAKFVINQGDLGIQGYFLKVRFDF